MQSHEYIKNENKKTSFTKGCIHVLCGVSKEVVVVAFVGVVTCMVGAAKMVLRILNDNKCTYSREICFLGLNSNGRKCLKSYVLFILINFIINDKTKDR